ncbi:MAG: DNA repair protein RadC [Gemmatimonadota bacterium]|jgi:DNA repair protein RadC|nr:DNA repair protein RadC [Gemmatimonadota bacterium]
MSAHSIREWPTTLRPRERLDRLTPHALSDAELLAILIETGLPASAGEPARTALDVAGDMLRRFAGPDSGPSLRRLMGSSVRELCAVPGIGPAKATKVLAALDLGRRAVEEARGDRERISSASDVHEMMSLALRDLQHEEFHVLLLSTRNEVIRRLLVTRGTLDASLVHPREVFRQAIRESAAGVILVHNHPSGDPTPSAEDRSVTRQMRTAGRIIGIDVIDHVIIGERRYISFLESGLLD